MDFPFKINDLANLSLGLIQENPDRYNSISLRRSVYIDIMNTRHRKPTELKGNKHAEGINQLSIANC